MNGESNAPYFDTTAQDYQRHMEIHRYPIVTEVLGFVPRSM